MTPKSAVAALSLLVWSATAVAKDPPPGALPEGASQQTFEERRYEVIVPAGKSPEGGWSPLLTIDGDGGQSVAQELKALAADGFLVVSPQRKTTGKHAWATSETEDLLNLLAHVGTRAPLAKDRLQVVTFSDSFGFASFVAFDKAARTVGFCMVDGTYRAKSPPASAKKQTAFLFLDTGQEDALGERQTAVERVADKYRTAEYRRTGPQDPYFRYWVHVADGRFVPGWDLSLRWIQDAAPPAGATKPGDAAQPADPPRAADPKAADGALARAKAECAGQGHGAVVYFWSATDRDKPGAKAFQNGTLFQPEVRLACGPATCVKLERERYEEAFASFGLKDTPAVVVVDAAFTAKKTFEGTIDAKQLILAAEAVAPAPKGKR